MGSGISQATGQIKGLGEAADQTQQKAKSSGMGVGAAFQFVALNAFNLATSLIQTKRSYEDLAKAENAQQNKRLAVTTTTNNLKKAEIALALARQKGDPARIAKAELTLENAKIRVDKATRAEKLGQIELNRAHEDFYLNIIPNVISGIGTLAGILQVAQNTSISFGGALTKLVLPLVAISTAFFAIKTNFFGFRDFLQGIGVAIGNAIPGLKPLLNVLEAIGGALGLTPKKTNLNKAIADLQNQFKPLIDFFKGLIDTVMKGDWNGAFKKIGDAAVAAWKTIKQQFPILGDIESLINKIQNGNWKGAFLQIAVAAKGAWETLIQSVPFFAGVDTFIKKIQTGNWKGAFDVIAKGARDALGTIFGEETITNFITQLQQIPAKLKAAMNVPGATAFSVIDAMIPTDVKNFAVWANTLVTNAITALGTALAEKLTFISTTWIDPFVASLFRWETWSKALSGQIDAITKTGAMVFELIANAIFPKDKQGAAAAALRFAQIAIAIVNAIRTWFETNLPTATAAFDGLVKSLQEVGTGAATNFVDFFTKGIPNAISAFGSQIVGGFGELGKKIQEGILGGLDGFGKWLFGLPGGVTPQAAKIPKPDITQVKSGVTAAQSLINGLKGKAVTIQTNHIQTFRTVYLAKGFHGMVNGPMHFVAGEAGPERVDVSPMGKGSSSSSSSSGFGNGSIIINLDGQKIAEVVSSKIGINQAVYR